jgi:septum site-determining protein MinC
MNAHVTSAPALNFRARSLLAFVLEPSQPLTEWFAGLDGWLTRSPSFFASKPIILEMAGLEFSLKDYRVVTGGRTVNAPAPVAVEDVQATSEPTTAEQPNSLIIDTNVRSGQSIVHPQGDVTIIGRVASGAEIIAGGSVHVYGALQGRVIAGISGLPSARIFCREAKAELLCIGGVYVTAEEMNPLVEGRSLEARLDGEELKFRVLD